MTWVKLPTRYYLDPRMLNLGEGAEVMYLRGLATAGEPGYDGVIPVELLHHLTRKPRLRLRYASQLVAAGYWEVVDQGYRVVDWKQHAKPQCREWIPLSVRLAIYERDGHACVFCGVTEPLSLDHIFPWSLGGSDHPDNLQTLCIPCNIRKGAKVT